MDKKEYLKKAFLAGHTLTVDPEMSLSAVQDLNLNDPIAKRIWKSWRESDANFDILMQQTHRRLAVEDDSWGPATEKLTMLPRCPIPDNPIPPSLNLDNLAFPNKEILDLWKDLQEVGNQIGLASSQWPRGCITPTSHKSKLDYSDRHAISIYLDTSGISSRWEQNLTKVVETVQQIYAEVGLVVLYYINGVPQNGLGENIEPNNSEISKIFGNIPGGVIGWNEFPRSTCRTTISGKLDSSWDVSLGGHITLEWHETGHGVGLSHTRGGVMNPSILFGLPFTFVNDVSFSAMRSKYGGQPVSIVPLNQPTPPPTPIPPQDIPASNGVFYLDGRIYKFTIDNLEDLQQPNGIFNWLDTLAGIRVDEIQNVTIPRSNLI